MNFIKLIPVILSMLLLGAHFYRAGLTVLVALCAVLLFVLLLRRPWAARLIQTVLVIGSIEWIRTMMVLSGMRQQAGAPWKRLALILGGVALFTVSSALVFRFRSLRERYRITSRF